MMGFETPADQRVAVPVRHWNAMKLAIWRSQWAWEIATRAAVELVDRCHHAEGCPGVHVETEPCLPECPDREQRLSALVILNASRMFAPVDAKKIANEPYFAPSREHFSEVLATLVAAQTELEALRAAGVRTQPPENNKELSPAAVPVLPAIKETDP